MPLLQLVSTHAVDTYDKTSGMEYVACNLCGSWDQEFVYSAPDTHFNPDEFFSVVACRNCGLGFVNPRPTSDEMARYYPSQFYHYFTATDQTTRYEAESRYVERWAGRSDGRKLLDVGCGIGDFPRFMARKGWNVTGVEPYCKTPIGDFPVHRVTFDQLEGHRERYDVVTAWAVIEHVHDPMSYFRKVSEVLKPGGIFCFLVTNFDSPSSKYLFQEDLPRHLYFFTKNTIQRYLHAVGLSAKKLYYGDDIYHMSASGWLTRTVRRGLLRRNYEWRDRPRLFGLYCQDKRTKRSAVSLARFAVRHPLSMVDQALTPVVEEIFKRTHTYGIVTCVAVKE